MSGHKVMIVEDDAELIRILQAVLKKLEVEIEVASTGRKALQVLNELTPSILLLDMRLPDMEGSEILNFVKQRGMPITVIVMTAHGSVDLAVDAMRQGAYDFLTKPLDFERIKIMVRNALERHVLMEQVADYKPGYERARFHSLRGSSPAMQRLYRLIQNNAEGSAPILIVGDMGTEREDCARAVYQESSRSGGPFVCLDISGGNTHEIRDSLFGKKGMPGAIEVAHEGTLFIDNVNELDRKTQDLLSDYIQTSEVEYSDGSCSSEVNTRILAGTDKSIKSKVESGDFDEDLYYALNVVSLHIPRLSDRGEDILDLTEQILSDLSRMHGKTFAKLSPEAEISILSFEWPENIDELKAALQHAVANHSGPILKGSMLPPKIEEAGKQAMSRMESTARGLEVAGSVKPLWEVEKEAIEQALKLTENNVIHAARLLQIAPATIYRKQRLWKSYKA